MLVVSDELFLYVAGVGSAGGRPPRVCAWPLARSPASIHTCRMVERPCRTNSDLKHIWQWLLPDTPLPTCGTNRKDEDTCKDAAGADSLGSQAIDQR